MKSFQRFHCYFTFGMQAYAAIHGTGPHTDWSAGRPRCCEFGTELCLCLAQTPLEATLPQRRFIVEHAVRTLYIGYTVVGKGLLLFHSEDATATLIQRGVTSISLRRPYIGIGGTHSCYLLHEGCACAVSSYLVQHFGFGDCQVRGVQRNYAFQKMLSKR